MRVMFITRGRPSERYKTLGIFEYDLAREIVAQGHDVIYVSLDTRSLRRWRKWGIHMTVEDGMAIYDVNLPLGRIDDRIRTRISMLALRRSARQIMQRHGIVDILHAHFPGPSYVGARLKSETGIPLVITEHSSKTVRKMGSRFFGKLDYAYREADRVIAVSQYLSSALQETFGVMPEVIPNMVDTSLFSFDGLPDQPWFDFVTVGNLIEEKGMLVTLNAFVEVHARHPQCRLFIYGEGPLRTKLEAVIKGHELEQVVFLMGLRHRKDIAEKLKESGCFVLASRGETFGVAYVEALASGVPVVATRCGGPEEIVHDANGILVDIDDLPALVEAMNRVMEYGGRFNRQEISEAARRTYSPEAVARKVIALYHKIV